MVFFTNNAEHLRITSGGNIGIGTNSPSNPLDISGGVAIGSSYVGVTTAPTNGLLLVQGNVGIGTTSPSALLQINTTENGTDAVDLYDTTGSAAARFYFTTPIGSPADLNINSGRVIFPGDPIRPNKESLLGGTISSNGSYVLIQSPSAASVLAVSSNNSGSVGIGTTTPTDKLDISGGVGLTATTTVIPTTGMYSSATNSLSLTASGI